jgi:flagellar hook protein FlgE
MSLYSAMYASVSALQSQSSAMAAISDNIANVSTIGYKDTTVSFQTLVTKQTNVTNYSSGGVFSKATQNVDVQGSLTASNSSTDVAISGNGFFVVNTSATPSASQGLMCYSRAGSFSVDQDGYLVNNSGYYLMGWPLQQATGTEPTTSLLTVAGDLYSRSYTKADGTRYYVNTNVVDNNEVQSLNINDLGGSAQPSLNIKLGANLPADNAVGSSVATTVSCYDALGITHNIDWTWTKTAANTWDLATAVPSGAASIALLNNNSTNANGTNTTTSSNAFYTAGQLEFTGTFDTTLLTGTSAQLAGSIVTINGTDYTFADAADAGAASTTIGTLGCTSWADVTKLISDKLNNADITGGTTGDFGSSAKPTTWTLQANGTYASNGAGGPSDNGTRFAYNSSSVQMVQSGNGTAITVDFSKNTNSALSTYCVTAGASGGSFSVGALDSTGNYWGADTNKDGDFADAGEVANLAAATFNGNGTPSTINVSDMAIRWANGAQDMVDNTTTNTSAINLFLGNQSLTDGLTQLSAPYQVNYLTQDGAKFGNFAGVEIGSDGVVTALFDNGVRTPIFQVPIATFVNPNGMESLTGNSWIQTDISGAYTLHVAGTAGAGEINAASLESSTVDLSTEFTTMIVTQRAYSAASKVITTANSMMDDLLGIIR